MIKALSSPRLLKACFWVGFIFIVYSRTIHGQFLWDDDDYVTRNLTLLNLSGLREIWFQVGRLSQYYPLTYTSFWVEYQLWGLNPVGYHCVNILLHAANGLLVWKVLEQLKIKNAWFIALLFSLHPVHVESVAWITERKNLLSGIFYLAAALAYLRTRYLFAFFFFLAALGSKTVTATLPVTLLILLWWRDGKLSVKDMGRLSIFLLTAFIFSSVTVSLETRHILSTGIAEWNFSWGQRVLIASRAVWFYFTKIVLPYPLIFIYPRWSVSVSNLWQWFYPAVSFIVMTSLWIYRKRLGRGALVGALIFVVTLLPALGFKNFYPMRYSFVADHFQYLASIPALVMLVTFVAQFFKNQTIRKVIACLILVFAALLTWQRQAAFTSPEALWQDTLKKNPEAWVAHNNRGTLLVEQNREEEAVYHFNETLRLKPNHAEAYSNLGLLKLKAGKPEEAIPYFEKAMEWQPHVALFQLNLGTAYFDLGKMEEAERHYHKALEMNPRFGEAYFSLGNIFLKKDQPAEAEAQFQEAVRFSPYDADAYTHLGYCLAKAGKIDEAISNYRLALKRNPQHANAHNNLANALSAQKKYKEAHEHYEKAIEIDSSVEAFRNNYADSREREKQAAR